MRYMTQLFCSIVFGAELIDESQLGPQEVTQTEVWIGTVDRIH